MASDEIDNALVFKALTMLRDKITNTPDPKMILEIDYSKGEDRFSMDLADVGTVDRENQIRSVLELMERLGDIPPQSLLFLITLTVYPLLTNPEMRKQLGAVLKEKEPPSNAVMEECISATRAALLQSLGLLASDPNCADLLKQSYHTPDVLNMINTKVTNVLYDPQYQEMLKESTDIAVGGQKKDLTVQTQLFLSVVDDDFVDQNGKVLPRTLTAYDRMVYDAVCSVLVANGDMLVTTRQIYEAFAGKTTNSPQALGHITRSLNKMRNTTLYLDCTPHVRTMNPGVDKAVYDENLLSFTRLTFSSGGREVSGYKFMKMPILFEYAMKVKQIITVPRALLEVGTISSTDTNNLIKTYLLRRIEMMKTKHNSITSNRIKYDPMLEYLGISAGSKVEYKRIRDTVKAILDFWKEQKYIKGYTEVKEGRRFSGVEILYQARSER